jgi:hypothetical protein
METIYKYQFSESPGHTERIEMPKLAKILTVQEQNGFICIWAIVNPEDERELRKFIALGTGWNFPTLENFIYISTVQESGLVWHVFEIV